MCKRCISYGVHCNYDGKVSELQFAAEGAFNVDIAGRFSLFSKTVPSSIVPVLRVRSIYGVESAAPFQLKSKHFDLIKKFQKRTIYTISKPSNFRVYQGELVRQGCSVSFLLLCFMNGKEGQIGYVLEC